MIYNKFKLLRFLATTNYMNFYSTVLLKDIEIIYITRDFLLIKFPVAWGDGPD